MHRKSMWLVRRTIAPLFLGSLFLNAATLPEQSASDKTQSSQDDKDKKPQDDLSKKRTTTRDIAPTTGSTTHNKIAKKSAKNTAKDTEKTAKKTSSAKKTKSDKTGQEKITEKKD